MGKTLVIAEKPSVAADLARALGKVPKSGNHFENDEYVITSAVGHLVELCLPGELDKKRGKWSFANLPIIPEEFALKTVEKSKDRFTLIKRLLKREDVTWVVNACDAGREGELIFHNIMRHCGSKKPVRRLWLQSMTPDAIRAGFKQLRDSAEMVPLSDAAVCRSESDWLVGINGTRAITAFNSKGGGFQLTPVGRVQTPTLAILAEREVRIREFVPRTYFEVFADFRVAAGSYRGRWFDEAFKKGAEDERAERLWERPRAEEIAARCLGLPGEIEEHRSPTSQIAPQLYDLTTLQREANSRFGLSARRTLQIAQALYERHKVLTYPRTDSRYLPSDYLGTVKSTFDKLEPADLAAHARHAMESGWVRPNRRIFDDAKVSDHFAIIPTGVSPKSLDDFELKVYDMVARRFVAAFYPAAQFEVTKRITRVAGEAFRSDGKVITAPGWMAVYGRDVETAGDKTLCAVAAGEKASTDSTEVKESQTKPPARFTESTLLSAMEGAGKLVEDEDLREAMSQRGLGTPATRAQIIEGLLLDGYLTRQGRDLIVTQKGLSLISLLRCIGIEALTSPEMTGEWEFKLKRMEAGEFARGEFMQEIRRFTVEIVDKAKAFEGEPVGGSFQDLEVNCPKCGAVGFKESYKAYECRGCGMLVWKNMAGRELEREEVATLLKEGRVGPLDGFRSRLGRPFSAPVKLDPEFKQTFDFADSAEGAANLDFSALPVVHETCPACKEGRIHDAGTSYICSRTPACKFRMGKSLCQHELPREQVIKLLTEGRTDLIRRFISKKGKPFSAFLKLEGAKVSFEFEERKSGARPKKGAATKKVAGTVQAAESAA
ncbi:MAG: DNA topoisomerase III [Terrimicrobiaceae bacterium]